MERSKSTLIEKDGYLPRLTRYIHRLPGDFSVTENPAEYPYSSYPVYISGSDCHCEPRQRRGEAISSNLEFTECNERKFVDVDAPEAERREPPSFWIASSPSVPRNDINMADEISEVLNHLSETGTDLDKQKAYERCVQSAEDGEIDVVRKLLHRTAFVGSKDFVEEMREKIQEHIIEEEKVRVARRPNRVFVLAGSLVILFLSIVTYNFYNNQSTLQNALQVTTSCFEVARKDLAKRVHALRSEVTEFEEKENHGLGGFAWELQLTPVQHEKKDQSYTDRLQFEGGQVISAGLMARGFFPFNYTISRQTHGKMIWQTTQTNTEGVTVRWYGVIAGNKMRGVLSERPVQGENRDFSFVSVRRLKNG